MGILSDLSMIIHHSVLGHVRLVKHRWLVSTSQCLFQIDSHFPLILLTNYQEWWDICLLALRNCHKPIIRPVHDELTQLIHSSSAFPNRFPLSKKKKKKERKWLDCFHRKCMTYIQLRASYCLTHKAICFCSCFQLITLTERAHSLPADEVWWWRLMMSASPHHHLASSTPPPPPLPLPRPSLFTLWE